MHEFSETYSHEHVTHVAFPLGGMVAGMLCLEGTDGFPHVLLRNQPRMFHQPKLFAALCGTAIGSWRWHFGRSASRKSKIVRQRSVPDV